MNKKTKDEKYEKIYKGNLKKKSSCHYMYKVSVITVESLGIVYKRRDSIK